MLCIDYMKKGPSPLENALFILRLCINNHGKEHVYLIQDYSLKCKVQLLHGRNV